MARLSKEQVKFLRRHEISLSRVMDVSGLMRWDYQSVMRDLGMIIAFGVTPCRAAGHTLRTRPGHCAQCNPANIAFLKRWREAGEVYVAHSLRTALTKIGVTQDHQDRKRNLNSQGYGGANDWRIHFHGEYNRAGQVEYLAQERLARYRVITSYDRTGETIYCQELFKCKTVRAINAVKKAAEEVG